MALSTGAKKSGLPRSTPGRDECEVAAGKVMVRRQPGRLTLARGVPRLHRGLQAALAQAEQPARAAPGRRRRALGGATQREQLRSMVLGRQSWPVQESAGCQTAQSG